jgi:endonuclease/exonuclease/phosphatase family metal-dependent hydrolase
MQRRSASVTTVPDTPGPGLRVGTFNLLHGRSLSHGGVHEADLRAAVAELDTDVLGLQEVDRLQERSGGLDQTAAVADALGAADWRFVPAMAGPPGTWTESGVDDGRALAGPAYGIGLVSRLPVVSWAVRRLPRAPVAMPLMVPGRTGLTQVPDEPRVALAAVLDSPRGPLTVVTTHLSFVPGWNVAQLRAVVRWAVELPAPRLLLGDLNLPGQVPRLVSGWTQLARLRTYPSYRPRVQFDHVLADGVEATAVHRAWALRLPVSDHCALAVDLRL